MVGTTAESEGIIRAGAEMVESMACATVPKIVLTINHASGAGYYALAGQGFDPDFTLGWPTARIGVMESDSAIRAMHGPEMDRQGASGQPLSPDLERSIGQTKADYERWLDATYAAARGHVDAIVDPVETRPILSFLLEVVTSNPRRGHLALDLMP
jgi:acetyl-CoA carboxylase carboxyltransferase component